MSSYFSSNTSASAVQTILYCQDPGWKSFINNHKRRVKYRALINDNFCCSRCSGTGILIFLQSPHRSSQASIFTHLGGFPYFQRIDRVLIHRIMQKIRSGLCVVIVISRVSVLVINPPPSGTIPVSAWKVLFSAAIGSIRP